MPRQMPTPPPSHTMLRTTLACVAVALLGGLAASWLTAGFEVWTAEGARRHAVASAPVAAPAATLLGQGLSGLGLQDLLASPGRVTIVSFLYTRCPGICQALGSSLQQLQQALSAPALHRADDSTAPQVRLLSISFDPAHDDIEQLQRYATLWRADPLHWRLATVPDTAQLQRLLKAWQVVVIADGRGGYEHNAALLVVDEQGRLVRIFDDTEAPLALAFARALLRPVPPGRLL